MATTLKPSRVLWLTAVFVTVFCVFVLVPPAEATTTSSLGCKNKFKASNGLTWACSQLTTPEAFVIGVPAKVTLKFRVRKTLRNVTVSIDYTNNPGRPPLKKTYKLLKKGRTVIASVMITTRFSPESSASSGRSSDSSVMITGQGALRTGNSWSAQKVVGVQAAS